MGVEFKRQELHVLNNMTGIGDMIGLFPIMLYLLKRAEEQKMSYVLFTRQLELFQLVLPKEILKPEPLYNKSKFWDNDSMRWRGRMAFWAYPTTLHMHAVDYLAMTVGDYRLEGGERNYPEVDVGDVDISDFRLPKKTVAIATGYTHPIKKFHSEAINGVARWVRDRGMEPVFLGQSAKIEDKNPMESRIEEGIDFSLGTDLTNKTSVLQLLKILKEAQFVVGMDGGIVHLAGMTKTPIICGYTHTRPIDKMPIREGVVGHNCYPVVPPESLECRFCQDKLWAHQVGFRECPMKTSACILTAQNFIDAIDKMLKETA